MNTAAFLEHLLGRGIRLRLDGERLVSEAPPGVLTPEAVAEIRARKAEIVAFLSRGTGGGPRSGPPILPRDAQERAPLSFAQQRLWFLAHLEGRPELYNMPLALALRGTLDKDALRRAIEQDLGVEVDL